MGFLWLAALKSWEFLFVVSPQESEVLEHLKDQLSESEASDPKSFLGLVSCSEAQQGGV